MAIAHSNPITYPFSKSNIFIGFFQLTMPLLKYTSIKGIVFVHPGGFLHTIKEVPE